MSAGQAGARGIDMEIVAIGSEIVECLRIGRMVDKHGESFLRRVFTDREICFCQSRQRAMEHFAARWAAKEAILKCLGAASRPTLSWTDMEIRVEAGGKAQVLMCGGVKDEVQAQRIGDILLTIAHCRAYATATAIAIRRPASEAE